MYNITVWVVASLGYGTVCVMVQSGLWYSLGYGTVWVVASLGYGAIWVEASLG